MTSQISVRLPRAALTHWAKILLLERIPADVVDPQAAHKAAALAQEFSETHSWALEQGEDFDLDELCDTVIAWARSQGYDLLDEPPCPYTPPPARWVHNWGPAK